MLLSVLACHQHTSMVLHHYAAGIVQTRVGACMLTADKAALLCNTDDNECWYYTVSILPDAFHCSRLVVGESGSGESGSAFSFVGLTPHCTHTGHGKLLLTPCLCMQCTSKQMLRRPLWAATLLRWYAAALSFMYI